MEFCRGDISIIIKKYEYESYDIFFKRGEFILKNKNSNLNFDELVKLSKVFTNEKFKKCKYSFDLNKKIRNLNYH